MAVYTLPDMPYDYGALEPAMSGEILELHHSKHHAAYVKGSNDALDQLAEARDKGDYATLVGLEKTFAFNLSGHVLHSIFWNNLSPDGGDRPDGVIAARRRGDLDGAEALLADLTLGLLQAQSGRSMDDLVRELSLHLATAADQPAAGNGGRASTPPHGGPEGRHPSRPPRRSPAPPGNDHEGRLP